jgi:tetratricopeptide (TPR) repeat protein
MGDVQQFRKDMNAALASYGQALELFRAVGSKLGEANVYGAMSRLDLQVGNIAEAEKLVARAVEIHQQIGDHYSVAADWGRFAIVLHNLGDKDRARACAARAEPFFREIGHPAADTMRKIMQD